VLFSIIIKKFSENEVTADDSQKQPKGKILNVDHQAIRPFGLPPFLSMSNKIAGIESNSEPSKLVPLSLILMHSSFLYIFVFFYTDGIINPMICFEDNPCFAHIAGTL